MKISQPKTQRATDKASASNAKLKVAYIMSRFPKISETFILYEILEMERLGASVEVFPLLREHQPVTHPEAEKMIARTNFYPFLSWAIVRANFYFMRTGPRTYFSTLLEVLFSTIGHLNFFFGALVYWPKSVAAAYKMQQQGLDHIHAHFCNHPALAAFIIHRLTGISYSFMAHGSDLHKNRTMLGRKVAASAFAATVSNFNLNVLRSACEERDHNKTHLLHCGIDPNVFSPQAHTVTSGPLRIICVASLEEVKGHKYLVEACRLLRERGVDFVCDLIGDGPRRAAITRQIKQAQLESQVIVHGSMKRHDVVCMLHAAQVKVLASVPTAEGKREGVPVVLMEAMACGLPVIASQLSGIPELVEHGRTGLLLPPGEAAGLAIALEQLQKDPALRQRMGQAGREKVLREYNLKENAKQLLQLIISTKGRNGAGANTDDREECRAYHREASQFLS